MTEEGEEQITIKVDRILQRSKEKLAGNNMLIFQCQSSINGIELERIKDCPRTLRIIK